MEAGATPLAAKECSHTRVPLDILVVEDAPEDAELALLVLQEDGFELEMRRVEDEAAYIAALDPSPDLILADWTLPKFSGLRALQLLASLGKDIPVIVFSGSIGEEAAVEAMRHGADDYILKDRPARLGQAVRNALEQKRSREARIAATTALRESEAALRQAQRVAHVGSWKWHIRENRVVWSDEMYRIFGIAKDDFTGDLGDVLARAIHPEDRERVEQSSMAVIRDRKPVPLEYRVIWPDGTEHVVWAEAGELLLDDAGEPVLLTGIVQDITERKAGEIEREGLLRQVQAQAEHVQQIIDTVPQGVLLLDERGTVLMANPAARDALVALANIGLGDTLRELGGHPLDGFLTSPPQGLWHEVQADQRVFEVIARPIHEGSRTREWVLAVTEVTRERQIRTELQQQERLAAIGHLAAGIAHDLNNVLSVVILYAHMAANAPDRHDAIRDWMDTITREVQHATRLIQQILDFSRRSVLERQPLDLLPLLKEQAKLLESALPENIEVVVDYAPGEYTVDVDPTRMRQMIMNLAVNARDAMPGGGILRLQLERLTVPEHTSAMPEHAPTVVPGIAPGDWIRLSVVDTGTGMSPEVVSHLFEPFFTTKDPGKGTGLGLAQVYGIVAQHEGHIRVETGPGRGSTFAAYLPALHVQDVQDDVQETMAMPQGHGERILVVEDNGAVRAALVSVLTRIGYRVSEAVNGLEALAAFKETGGEIALVLSDVVMPEMGGVALLRRLRENGWSTPLILLTGHTLDMEIGQLWEDGLSSWLTKPPTPEQLAVAIRSALRAGPAKRRRGGHCVREEKMS